ncbi:hypothetical protein [Glutamicibacter uratoxydans]|nr:hypothetical protein [Glutamicibacter uratoxydans]
MDNRKPNQIRVSRRLQNMTGVVVIQMNYLDYFKRRRCGSIVQPIVNQPSAGAGVRICRWRSAGLAAEELGEEPGLRFVLMTLATVAGSYALHDSINVLAAASPGGLLADLALNLTAHGASFRAVAR